MGGSLTSSNQHYVLFPFTFFRAMGALSAHIGYGTIATQNTWGLFQFKFTLGAIHVFSGDVSGSYHYKYKRLFGSSEAEETLSSFDLGGLGAAFLLIDISMPSLPVGKHTFAVGIQKAFAVPWGIGRFQSDDVDSDSGGGDGGGGGDNSSWIQPGLIRSIFLSGLSVYVKLVL
jgi:hypothetical protein